MRSIATALLFPYFLPLMVISAVAFAWMLVTPNNPGVKLSAGGDVLGLYFMMICALVGGFAQVLIGIPFCLLLKGTASPFWRVLLAAAAVALPLVPFGYFAEIPFGYPPGTLSQSGSTVVVVVGCFAAGVLIPVCILRPLKHLDGAGPFRARPTSSSIS